MLPTNIRPFVPRGRPSIRSLPQNRSQLFRTDASKRKAPPLAFVFDIVSLKFDPPWRKTLNDSILMLGRSADSWPPRAS
jgi:hypothetical protein